MRIGHTTFTPPVFPTPDVRPQRSNVQPQPASGLLGTRPVNPAGAVSILPVQQASPLSFETVLSLQRLDEPEQTFRAPTATERFLVEARKSPMERLREQILRDLGITEAELAAMPADERRAWEDKIREIIEEKMRRDVGASDTQADSNAEAMLETMA